MSQLRDGRTFAGERGPRERALTGLSPAEVGTRARRPGAIARWAKRWAARRRSHSAGRHATTQMHESTKAEKAWRGAMASQVGAAWMGPTTGLHNWVSPARAVPNTGDNTMLVAALQKSSTVDENVGPPPSPTTIPRLDLSFKTGFRRGSVLPCESRLRS